MLLVLVRNCVVDAFKSVFRLSEKVCSSHIQENDTMTKQEMLISYINKPAEDEISSLLDAVALILKAKEPVAMPPCPYCGSSKVNRSFKGKRQAYQRYAFDQFTTFPICVCWHREIDLEREIPSIHSKTDGIGLYKNYPSNWNFTVS